MYNKTLNEESKLHLHFHFEDYFCNLYSHMMVGCFEDLCRLKLTCHHINRRHFCFNIKSSSVHPLLWMNVMLDFIGIVFTGM